MSRWTAREDIPFIAGKTTIQVDREGGGITTIEGKGSIYLEDCPYFVNPEDPMCWDDSGGGECTPFAEYCRLYRLMTNIDRFKRGLANTWK